MGRWQASRTEYGIAPGAQCGFYPTRRRLFSAVANAGRTGRAPTGSLANAVAIMVYRVRRREEGAIKLRWVKGHVGVVGNEEADKRAGWCTSRTGERLVTEGDIRVFLKEP